MFFWLLQWKYTSSIQSSLQKFLIIASLLKPDIFDKTAIDLNITDMSMYDEYNLTDDADYSLSENRGNTAYTRVVYFCIVEDRGHVQWPV